MTPTAKPSLKSASVCGMIHNRQTDRQTDSLHLTQANNIATLSASNSPILYRWQNPPETPPPIHLTLCGSSESKHRRTPLSQSLYLKQDPEPFSRFAQRNRQTGTLCYLVVALIWPNSYRECRHHRRHRRLSCLQRF